MSQAVVRSLGQGSSPLTRGKQYPLPSDKVVDGLIPAHAGKTSRCGATRRRCRAHPRSRGENDKLLMGLQVDPGSSPLTRGKHRRTQRHCLGRGLIPAHAGKTCPAAHASSSERAHPRSRGENIGDAGGEPAGAGSSPLTRGKQIRSADGIPVLGLIPAHAGKTPRPKKPCARAPAHPRSRGENNFLTVR